MKSLTLIIPACVAIALTATPLFSVAETGLKESVRSSGAAAKDAVQHIGHDAKELGRGLAVAARDTGRAIGRGASSAAKDVSTGFRRDFIEGRCAQGPAAFAASPGAGHGSIKEPSRTAMVYVAATRIVRVKNKPSCYKSKVLSLHARRICAVHRRPITISKDIMFGRDAR